MRNGKRALSCKPSGNDFESKGSKALALKEKPVSLRKKTCVKKGAGKALSAGIRLYQITFSPFIGPCCRYVPCCSDYMIQAIELYGPVRGVILGLRRLGRCHPLARRSRYDPVPDAWQKGSHFDKKISQERGEDAGGE